MSILSQSRIFLMAVALACCVLAGVTLGDSKPLKPATIVPSDANFKDHTPWNIMCAERVGAVIGKQVDVMFIGDSITQNFAEDRDGNWELCDGITVPHLPGRSGFDLTGLAVWRKHYAGRHVLDFGVGADGTEHVLWRLDNLQVDGLKPKVLVVLVGTNDTAHSTSEEIALGVRAVLDKSLAKFPGAKVIVISILPNARALEKCIAANQLIRKFADDKNVFYFDLASMMTPEANGWNGIGHDRLHLTQQGYEMWATEMEPLLSRLLKASTN
jgi:lysophospholipase L1-like esterase